MLQVLNSWKTSTKAVLIAGNNPEPPDRPLFRLACDDDSLTHWLTDSLTWGNPHAREHSESRPAAGKILLLWHCTGRIRLWVCSIIYFSDLHFRLYEPRVNWKNIYETLTLNKNNDFSVKIMWLGRSKWQPAAGENFCWGILRYFGGFWGKYQYELISNSLSSNSLV